MKITWTETKDEGWLQIVPHVRPAKNSLWICINILQPIGGYRSVVFIGSWSLISHLVLGVFHHTTRWTNSGVTRRTNSSKIMLDKLMQSETRAAKADT